jgi:hypothetical protein
MSGVGGSFRCWVPVLVAGALAIAACGGGRDRPAAADACARAGFSGGTTAADGEFFAVIPRGCARGRAQECVVADGTGPIDREVVDAGIEQSCVAFNQFVGSGLTQVPGYVTGECFGRAAVSVAGGPARRVRFAPRRCRLRGGRSPDAGPAPPPLDRAAPGTTTVEGRARDPWGRAPESGAVGGRPLRPPPWALLVWRSRGGATCYEPGQVVDHGTPGRSDQLPGIRPTGRGITGTLVGSLRFDSRSGTGIQLYGLGRFEPYPVSETGSCGFPERGAGLLLSRESQYPRRDLSLGHTIVSGVAGPRIAGVAVDAGERRIALRLSRRRAFLWVVRGVVGPRAVRVVVRYADGRRRVFAG